ncbi:MAG: hypothetical protein HYX38_01460 [Rhodospirillales bacterium]|nr:hypothetical protein [Rhodospirillales bacterium]
MQLHDLTLTELSAGLVAKKFSSREIVDALLGRIAKANDKLHAFTEVYAKEAKAMADGADKARAGGFPLGPLHGLPIAYKDLCDIAGRIGTGGSKMFEKRVATETSNTVERLTAAGMVPLGKLHMVEFIRSARWRAASKTAPCSSMRWLLPMRATRRRSANRSKISRSRPSRARSRACALPCPTPGSCPASCMPT